LTPEAISQVVIHLLETAYPSGGGLLPILGIAVTINQLSSSTIRQNPELRTSKHSIRQIPEDSVNGE